MAYIRILPNETQNLTEVLDWVGHIIYACQLYVCRLSGLAFYHRLSERHNSLLMSIYIGAGFITAAFIPQIFLLVFHCQPVTGLWPYEWQPEFPQYTCMLWGVVHATNSALSVSCDLVLFGIPIAIIYLVRATVKQKLILSAVLLPGVL